MNEGTFQVLYREFYMKEQAAEQISLLGFTLVTLGLCC